MIKSLFIYFVIVHRKIDIAMYYTVIVKNSLVKEIEIKN